LPLNHKPLLVVLGPTGSGKSELALRLAAQFHGEIVNCDSLQLYRGFDVGTAKTPESERRGIPHHLIDILDAVEIFTAGEYARRARVVLDEIALRNRLPVVVGGTGFYLRALFDGLVSVPARDETLRARLLAREQARPGTLHRLLARLDPPSAGRIHANDRNKLVRALELCLKARRPLSDLYREGREPLSGFSALKIGLNPPRETLYARLDERSQRMFAGGLIDEVRQILGAGTPRSAKPFEAIGYKEALAYLSGALSAHEAIELMRRHTRRYAKRQMTWFRREPDVCWLAGFGSEPPMQALAVEYVDKHLPSRLNPQQY
jgi:tRNA dimethylallyltransferase